MPRISADTVAEHVAQQEEALFRAAISLFLERGYADVTLGDIAAAVGLKRTSLYRYFPDKAHILARWLCRELDAESATSEELLRGEGEVVERVERWVEHQLAYARRPEHALVRAAPEAERDLDDATRAELADGHRRLLAPLSELLRGMGRSEAETAATTALLFGLVRAAVDAEPSAALHRQLSAAIGAVLAG